MIKEEVLEMRKNIEEMHKSIDKEENLAMTLLHEIKQSAKRNFIAFIITLIALVGTNVGWLIYESQWDYSSEETTQTIEDIDNSDNSNFSQSIN